MVTYELEHFRTEGDTKPSTLLEINSEFIDYNCNVSTETRKDRESDASREVYVYDAYRFPRSFKYEDVVNGLIRLHYTLSEELALQRQRDSKADEFQAYSAKCDECKALAKEIAKAREEAKI